MPNFLMQCLRTNEIEEVEGGAGGVYRTCEFFEGPLTWIVRLFVRRCSRDSRCGLQGWIGLMRGLVKGGFKEVAPGFQTCCAVDVDHLIAIYSRQRVYSVDLEHAVIGGAEWVSLVLLSGLSVPSVSYYTPTSRVLIRPGAIGGLQRALSR